MPLGSFPFSQSLACQPTQPIAAATIPTAVLDPGISTNSTLYPAYARVNQHDHLNPEYPNGTIPDYQDFQIFGDIEETDINNEGINDVGASTPAHEDTNSTKKQLPRSYQPVVSWKLHPCPSWGHFSVLPCSKDAFPAKT